MDNQVLPPGVTPESAEKEGWWFKGDYIINQLNTNSAMWSPAHDEVKLLQYENADGSASDEPSGTYEMGGYAYTGNGTKIHRVEVSFDNGQTWERTTVEHPEKPTEYGKYWCWCFWKYSASMAQLANCGEVVCRAWDGCQNTQPKDITWNVMGMMNNPWFRIKVHKTLAANGRTLAVRFEHPTLAGQQKGGWMTRDESEAGWKRTPTGAILGLSQAPYSDAETPSLSLTASPPIAITAVAGPPKAVKPAATKAAASGGGGGGGGGSGGGGGGGGGQRRFSMEEIAKHTGENDSWFVVNGKVFDSSAYNKEHPGGAESILMVAGEDATEDFEAIHSRKAWKLLESYQIGIVDDGSGGGEEEPAAAEEAKSAEEEKTAAPLVTLGKKKVTVPLLETRVVGNDGTNDVSTSFAEEAKYSILLSVPTHLLRSQKNNTHRSSS